METLQAQETYLTLNEKYRITSDGSRNLILQEKYQKREGKGKNAPLSNEFDFRDCVYFGAGLVALIKRLNEREFLEVFNEVERAQDIVEALQEMKQLLAEREQRIYEHVKEHVTLELKNVKE